MRRKWAVIAPLAILGIAVFVAVGGWIVQLLWNGLLPSLFGWRTITFWQALGLLVLCRILFGGHGFRTSGGSNVRRRMAERWGHMTPEERERFREGLRTRFGFGPRAGESKEE
jgi:hypothetical protein